MKADIVIRGATIYDGTGGVPFDADIAIVDTKEPVPDRVGHGVGLRPHDSVADRPPSAGSSRRDLGHFLRFGSCDTREVVLGGLQLRG